jgi:predicted nucleotidyltransferase
MGYRLRPDPVRTARLEQALAQIVARLPATDVQLAVVFGSLARDDVGTTSDLDLLLVRPTDERFVKRTEDLSAVLDVPVGLDVLVYTPEEFARLRNESPSIRQALATGRTVYEAQPRDRSEPVAPPG